MNLRATTALFAALVCTLMWGGCGAGTSTVVREDRGAPEGTPIDLTFQTIDGRVVELADQRGSPVLLLMFASYDDGSQAAFREAAAYARDHLDVLVLGVMVQPDARTFAPLFDETMHPPFAIVFEVNDSVREGTSELGPLPGIPTFYVLDANGALVDRVVGYASRNELEHLVGAHQRSAP